MYGHSGEKFGVQSKEGWPRCGRIARASDVGAALFDDGIVGGEAGDDGFERVHVGVLEDVDHHDDLVKPEVDQEERYTKLDVLHLQHVPQSLPRQSRIRICQVRYPPDMIHAIDILRYPRRGYIPIIVLERIQVNECDGNMPIFTIGRVRIEWEQLHFQAVEAI